MPFATELRRRLPRGPGGPAPTTKLRRPPLPLRLPQEGCESSTLESTLSLSDVCDMRSGRRFQRDVPDRSDRFIAPPGFARMPGGIAAKWVEHRPPLPPCPQCDVRQFIGLAPPWALLP